MATEKVAAKVAEHDAANRKAADLEAEEQELQARMAATSKPLETASPVIKSTAVMPTPRVSEQLRPALMPDGSPVPELTRADRLELALKNLVACLDEMAADETFKRVWQVAKDNGAVYEGRVWKPELDFAKLTLQSK